MSEQIARRQPIRGSEAELWAVIRDALRDSNCLKTQTAAAVVKDGTILSIGFNLCSPRGSSYGDALSACPRTEIKTGTNYELCAPVHAEVMSCLNIRPVRNSAEIGNFAGHLELPDGTIRSAFTKEELTALNGSSLWLVGHYWACNNCQNFLRAVGITDLKLDKITGEETRRTYEERKLT